MIQPLAAINTRVSLAKMYDMFPVRSSVADGGLIEKKHVPMISNGWKALL